MKYAVQRNIYTKICKHEVVINLIKREYFDDQIKFDAIKININEKMENVSQNDMYSKLKFLIESGAQSDFLDFLNSYYQLNDKSFKFKLIEVRNLRMKEYEGMDMRKPNVRFDDVVDECKFDNIYTKLLNDSVRGGKNE